MTGTPEQPGPARASKRRWIALAVCAIALVILGTLLTPAYLTHKATVCLRDRAPDKALKVVQRLEDFSGPSGESSLLAARALRLLGRMNEAQERLEQATRLGATPARAQREQWLCFAQSGQMSLAGPHLGELLLSPGDDAAAICEAFVAGYVLLQRYADAQRLLDGWLADFPEDDQAWFFRGRIQAAGDQASEALKSFRQALKINPARNDIRLHFATTLADVRDYPAAEREFARLLKTQPDSPEVLREWATLLTETGRGDEAAEVCRRILTAAPDDFDTELQLARLLFQLGEYDESHTRLKHLHAKSPGHKDVRFLLGSVLRQTGEQDKAREHLQYAREAEAALAHVTEQVQQLEQDPSDVGLRFSIAQSLMKYGREREGAGWLRTVLDFEPGHQDALQALIEHLEKIRQPEAAQAYRQRLRESQSAPAVDSTTDSKQPARQEQ
jgi:tetratricopeptide (TPR) repeat protein